jgi:hypothetical protein
MWDGDVWVDSGRRLDPRVREAGLSFSFTTGCVSCSVLSDGVWQRRLAGRCQEGGSRGRLVGRRKVRVVAGDALAFEGKKKQ